MKSMSVGTLFLPRVYEQICPYFCWFKPRFGWFLNGFKSYPPVIKLTHGLLENPPFSSMIFPANQTFISFGEFPTTFDTGWLIPLTTSNHHSSPSVRNSKFLCDSSPFITLVPFITMCFPICFFPPNKSDSLDQRENDEKISPRINDVLQLGTASSIPAQGSMGGLLTWHFVRSDPTNFPWGISGYAEIWDPLDFFLGEKYDRTTILYMKYDEI